MAFTTDHLYVTFGGTAPGNEIWQTGLRFEPEGAGPAFTGWDLISVSDIGSHVEALVSTLTSLWPDDIYVNWTKLAAIKADGEYDREPKVHEHLPAVAGTASVRLPLQCAVVVSLWSGMSFGKANHGKMYLPSLDFSRSSGHAGADAARASTVGIAMQTFIHDVDGEVSTAGMNYRPAIMSDSASPVTKPVAKLRVGRLADTQQRRRRGASEDYYVDDYSGPIS